jgi:hypothetical protein
MSMKWGATWNDDYVKLLADVWEIADAWSKTAKDLPSCLVFKQSLLSGRRPHFFEAVAFVEEFANYISGSQNAQLLET